MALYRSRPQTIEAVQWTGDNVTDLWDVFGARKIYGPHETNPTLRLLAGKDGAQGWVSVPVGHWIVRKPGDDSDMWPVDPEYFASIKALEAERDAVLALGQLVDEDDIDRLHRIRQAADKAEQGSRTDG